MYWKLNVLEVEQKSAIKYWINMLDVHFPYLTLGHSKVFIWLFFKIIEKSKFRLLYWEMVLNIRP